MAFTHTHTHTCIHTYTHTHIYTNIHIHTYTQMHTHTYMHTHTNMHTQTCTHTYTDMRTHIYRHIHTRAHTHIHTDTYTHIDTQTHTHSWQHLVCMASRLQELLGVVRGGQVPEGPPRLRGCRRAGRRSHWALRGKVTGQLHTSLCAGALAQGSAGCLWLLSMWVRLLPRARQTQALLVIRRSIG